MWQLWFDRTPHRHVSGSVKAKICESQSPQATSFQIKVGTTVCLAVWLCLSVCLWCSGFSTRSCLRRPRPKNVPFADIPEHVCSVTGPVVLVFLDIEHTGHPVYYADMMQFGAVAHYFDQGAFTATPALTFVEDTYTAQTINFALDPHFHRSFLRSRLRDASQFADVMAAFKLELTNVMHSLKCSSCMFGGHNIFKCDGVVLQCQFARIGVQFEQFLEDVNCLGCVDTYSHV